MAKNSPKSKGSNDPAVSAVEEALKIDFGAEDTKSDGPSRRRLRRSRRDEEPSGPETERTRSGRNAGAGSRAADAAANDAAPRRERSAADARSVRPMMTASLLAICCTASIAVLR